MKTVHPEVQDRQNLPQDRTDDAPIVYFDGVCGLCNRVVNLVLSRDPGGGVRFAPLQGETARERLAAHDVESLSTLIVTTPRGTYRRSAAVVRILWHLGWTGKVLAALLWVIPRPLRDLGYQLVASSRYRWFGQSDTCRMPTDAERARSCHDGSRHRDDR